MKRNKKPNKRIKITIKSKEGRKKLDKKNFWLSLVTLLFVLISLQILFFATGRKDQKGIYDVQAGALCGQGTYQYNGCTACDMPPGWTYCGGSLTYECGTICLDPGCGAAACSGPTQYTVTYTKNIAAAGTLNPTSRVVNSGSSAAGPTVSTNTGYVFVNFSIVSGSCAGTFTASTGTCSNVQQNMTIQANWSIRVSYTKNIAAAGTLNPTYRDVAYGASAQGPTVSTNSGYVFVNFSIVSGSCAGTFTASTGTCSNVQAPLTIRGNWGYTVTVNGNNGTCSPGTHSVAHAGTSSAQSCVRSGYVLSSFSQTGCGGTFNSSTGVCSSVTQAMTITANWTAMALSAPLNLVATYDDGKVFLGWRPPVSGGYSVTDYLITYSDDGGASWMIFDDGTSSKPFATVTGLTNNQQYMFRVSAKNASGTWPSSSTVQSTPQTLAITNLSSTNGLFLGGGSMTIGATGLGDTQKFTEISPAGDGHTCGLAIDGNAYCWGRSNSGQLGDGQAVGSSIPVLVSKGDRPTGVTFTKVNAGRYHTCGIGSNGQGYCWGYNASGQVGNGSTNPAYAPALVSQGARPSGGTFTDISAGGYYSCGVGNNGQAYCWGANGNYQLGTGNTTGSSTPVLVIQGARPSNVTYTSVDTGHQHTCGLGSDGNGYCWGEGAHGRLGNGGTTSTGSPVLVSKGARPTGVTFTKISGGGDHTCGIGSNGQAYCWGRNNYGQLGNGNTGTDSSIPVLVSQGARGSGVTFTSIDARYNYTCAVGSDGNGYCWGLNTDYQFGNGGTGNSNVPALVSQGARPAGVTFNNIGAGGNQTCGVGSDGNGYCWGNNTDGHLGDGTTTNRSTPVLVKLFDQYEYQITIGNNTLAQTVLPQSTGITVNPMPAHAVGTVSVSLKRIYDNKTSNNVDYTYDNLLGPDITSITPSTVAPNTSNTFSLTGTNFLNYGPINLTGISTGNYHTCGVNSNGDGYCWGEGTYGKLGNGSTTNRSTPVLVSQGARPAGVTFSSISAGENHTCGVGSNGRGYCWGYNPYGQLGNGNTGTDSSIPVLVSTVVFSSISVGENHSCGVGSDGKGYCWGRNGSGQLGNGNTNDSNIPVLVSSGSITFSSISAGRYHTCGVASNGNGYCWGNGSEGRLGNGGTANSSVPVLVNQGARPGGVTFVSMTLGPRAQHSCAVGSDGNGYCWGYNGQGQLGNGSTTGSNEPVLVSQGARPGGVTFSSIAGGGNHTCGLGSDGKGYCWGSNWYGRLGDGTTNDSSVPVLVSPGVCPAGETFTSVIGGVFHSCGLLSNNRAVCWGQNSVGDLGTDDQIDRFTPAYVIIKNTKPTIVFRNIPATSTTYTSTTAMSAVSPTLGAGTIEVKLTNPDGQYDIYNIFAGSVPSAPLNLVATYGDGQVSLGWKKPVDEGGGVTDYRIEYSNDGGNTWAIVLDGSTNTFTTITGLTNGNLYTFRVAAKNPMGTGAYSNTVQSTPQALAITGISPTSGLYLGGGSMTIEATGLGDYQKFTQVSSGSYHTCALALDGNVYCWGDNFYGQLGNGSSGSGTNSTVPVLVSQGDRSSGVTFVSISAGYNHTCGVGSDGEGYCWGYNYNGQLGNGSSGSGAHSNVPILVSQGDRSSGVTFVSISAGNNHTCGVGSDGESYCWGYNNYGQLGNGSSGSDTESSVPVLVSQGDRSAGVTFVSISVGPNYTCGVGSDGEGYCWGYNNYGQLGNGNTGTNSNVPKLVSQGARPSAGITFVSISAGYNHTCGVGSDGEGYCWGYNYNGQLGNGSSGSGADSNVPVLVSLGVRKPGDTFVSIDAGGYHTCGVGVGGGHAYCWGQGTYGKLGDGYTTQRTTPVLVSQGARPSGVSFNTISADSQHTCSVGSDGNGYCWGYNNYGQLGDGYKTQRSSPVLVLFFTSYEYQIAIGNNTLTQSISPGSTSITVTQIPAHVVGEVSVSLTRVCDNEISNSTSYTYVNLPAPDITNINPSIIPPSDGITINLTGTNFLDYGPMNTFSGISAGGNHSCGLDSDGEGYCWGQGTYGKLGDGYTTQRTTPVLVSQGDRLSEVTFSSISTGYHHSCGIGSDGEGYCWGYNNYGQLGNGNTGTSSSVPKLVSQGDRSAGVTFSSISVGFYHTCGIGSDGNGYCWGHNYNGQLGNGNTGTNSNVPKLVSQGDRPSTSVTFVSISVGSGLSCGIGSDGNGYCWGNNNYGQLGNGNTGTNSNVPRLVSQGDRSSGVTFNRISAGQFHSCGVGSDGEGYCWGYNSFGQLGNGNTGTNSNVPKLVSQGDRSSGVTFSRITAGSSHSCGIGSDGQGYCWGYNNYGQLGNGNTGTNSGVPVFVSQGARSLGVTLTNISAGYYHTCGVGSNGQGYCWGYNNYGQLGNNETVDRMTMSYVLKKENPKIEFGTILALSTTYTSTTAMSAVSPEGLSIGTLAIKLTNPDGQYDTYDIAVKSPPSPPGNLSATPGNTQVTLTWSVPSSDGGSAITDYIVQYSTDNSTWTTFDDGVSTSTSATVTGLTNGQQYYFRVAAVNSVGQGPYTSSVTATPVNQPPTFTSVSNNSPVAPGSSVTWNTTAYDPDSNQVKLVVCDSQGITGSTCNGTELCSSSLVASNPSCSHTATPPYTAGPHDAYVYVFDGEGLAASGGVHNTNSVFYINNVAPSVLSVTLNSGNAITLLESTTTSVSIKTQIESNNGCQSIGTVTAYLYRSGKGYSYCNTGAHANNNYCYSEISCIRDAGECTAPYGKTAKYTCTASVWYYADPTDNNTVYSSENWLATVKALGGGGTVGTAQSSTGVEMNSLIAFDVTSTLNYGSLFVSMANDPLDKVVTTTATGNVGLNQNHSGVGMGMCVDYNDQHNPCSVGTPIDLSYQKYSTLASTSYTDSTNAKTLTSTPTLVQLKIPKVTSTPTSANTWWGISIPSNILPGAYEGRNRIEAVKSPISDW
jgi:alpha-tubulin suppressor-like RCC1 family protein